MQKIYGNAQNWAILTSTPYSPLPSSVLVHHLKPMFFNEKKKKNMKNFTCPKFFL